VLRLVILNDTHMHTNNDSSEWVIGLLQIPLHTKHTTRDTTQEKNIHASERDSNPQSPQGPQTNREATGMVLSIISNFNVK